MGNRKKGTAGSSRGSAAAANGKFSLITNEKLISLYANLLQCRQLRRQDGANGGSGTIRGHEAALVGSTIDLGTGDSAWFHEHGAVTGFSHDAMIAEILLRAAGGSRGTVGARKATGRRGVWLPAYTHAAIGTALANKTTRNKKVTLVFSSNETEVLAGEALHIAAVHALPMVFIHQADRHAKGFGSKPPGGKSTPWFPNITVDQDDVVAVYRVASEAISRARLDRGPTFIGCVPFLVGLEAGAGNGQHAHDPIRHMEHYLRARDLFHPEMKASILAELPSR